MTNPNPTRAGGAPSWGVPPPSRLPPPGGGEGSPKSCGLYAPPPTKRPIPMPFWHFFGWGGHLENWGRILTPFFGPKYKKFVTPGGYPPPIDDHVTQRTPPHPTTKPSGTPVNLLQAHPQRSRPDGYPYTAEWQQTKRNAHILLKYYI